MGANLTRRQFLRGALAAAGAAVVGGVGHATAVASRPPADKAPATAATGWAVPWMIGARPSQTTLFPLVMGEP